MVTRSSSPASHRRAPRRGPTFRTRLLLRLLGLLLVAAIVVGIGTTTDTGWGPDFREDGPHISAEEQASRDMLNLARTATGLATGTVAEHHSGAAESGSPAIPSPAVKTIAVDARTAKELERTAALLHGHVELLTPGLEERLDQEAAERAASGMPGTDGTAAAPPPSEGAAASEDASRDSAVAEVAMGMAESANKLLDAASSTVPDDVAAVLGAGIEQRLEAQRLAALLPADAAPTELPTVRVEETDAAWKDRPDDQLPAGSCTADGSSVASPSGGSDAESKDPKAADEATSADRAAARAVLEASDAAFRLAYGYQMAAIKHPGASTHRGWDLAATTSDLGHQLEDLLPADCPPTRETAYALPTGFNAAPLTSVAGAEGQLAALLRDAAGQVPEAHRPALMAEAWRSADRLADVTGTMPDLT